MFGRSAHAGIAPENGLNAIIMAAKALSQILDGRINEKTTANIGTINGGIATNIVPMFAVVIHCGTRSQDLTELQLITEKNKNIIERVVNAKSR
ncbi:MAG: peptidase dimerization domain-containing protein [Bacillota bacterium]|nr:peptidase dimerization domain-containing protein [Bacillota bacterium]